jgi:hypothetical protein
MRNKKKIKNLKSDIKHLREYLREVVGWFLLNYRWEFGKEGK